MLAYVMGKTVLQRAYLGQKCGDERLEGVAAHDFVMAISKHFLPWDSNTIGP